MDVSVIVPAYNAAATIAETLQSVCSQSLGTWEVVVVNDGSTDDTGAIARAFALGDQRIRVVDQRNGGEAAARNSGVRRAQHPWLLCLDSDDWIAPRHLEMMTGQLS
ncbi:MAG TPA: glycosyltransferase family 2 protein, partial [Vicinamibacterales bacterium]|nr:glycosyltransferase family 2 protein [Vicinamibacterales bacterium]